MSPRAESTCPPSRVGAFPCMMLPGMRIEVICTGDEVLTGKIVNTNFSYISQKLEDVGLSVSWETTVGDDRESLLLAFQLAGERADAVIVNGGLGPTIDDLSQEIAAQAAGVRARLERGVAEPDGGLLPPAQPRRCRPTTASRRCCPRPPRCIDNPIGTACGFALDIGKARFFFTPGVPRELRRMLEEQIIPRLLAQSGLQTADLPEAVPLVRARRIARRFAAGRRGGAGARRQREARLPRALPAARDQAHRARRRHGRHPRASSRRSSRKCASGSATSFWPRTTRRWRVWCWPRWPRARRSLAVVETFTSGQIAARIAHLPGAEKIFRRGIVARDLGEVCAAVGLDEHAARPARSRARRPKPWRAPRTARPAPPMRWRC